MASYGKSRGSLGRIVILVLINLILAAGLVVWFDYLGIINARIVLDPVYRLLRVPVRQAGARPEDPGMLEEDRAAKQEEAILIRSQELDKTSSDLSQKEQEIEQRAQDLDERQKALDDQEKSFSEKQKAAETRNVNIEQNARRLTAMPPAAAVKILNESSEQDVIDVLRAVDAIAASEGTSSIVPYWFSLMDPARAASIQRKMTIKPVSLE